LLRLLHICVEMEHTTSVENKPGINGKKSYWGKQNNVHISGRLTVTTYSLSSTYSSNTRTGCEYGNEYQSYGINGKQTIGCYAWIIQRS
jgi:hypothetical protein